MSMHLFQSPQVSANMQLCLLLAYENGSVSLVVRHEATEKSIEGRGWERVWTVKSHVESGKQVHDRMYNLSLMEGFCQ